MIQIQIPRDWYLVIAGLADWRSKSQQLSIKEFNELKYLVENYISRLYRTFKKQGAFAANLLWSQENVAPLFLFKMSKTNEQFLKEQRVIFNNISDKIFASLSIEERQSSLGKNLQQVKPEGKILIMKCSLPSNSELFLIDEQLVKIFSDALNSELLTIKRAEHDFNGRKNWLATLEAVCSREWMEEVGPIKKLKEAKEVENKKQYEQKTPGDFEKIIRILSEAIPFRTNLFEIEKPKPSFETQDPLGHIIIQYLSTKGNLPLKMDKRSIVIEQIGRKVEYMLWALSEGIDLKELDNLLFYTEGIIYDKVEKVIKDVGGIKFDALWTERNLSNNIYFLSKFTFTEDILKQLKELLKDPRTLLEEHLTFGTTPMVEIWNKAGINFNLLIFEVKGFDSDEEKKFAEWIRKLKNKEIPGPNYIAEKELLIDRYYRPL